ncbi:MAG TPA: Ig-like domain-containing protein [Gemmatimonadales bacterium]|nr:Ig-like domain-containing protein [Gemmatimonadales bacterium]
MYVSLTPGTAPAGLYAIVQPLGDTVQDTTTVFNGGFDPVPVPAQTGDTIAVQVFDADERVVFEARSTVTAARPPVVVRTEPPPQKRDVPLNATMVIVFSEPIDPSTLTASTVRLVQGSTTLVGQVTQLTGSATTVAFTPADPLTGSTDYRLVITRDIQDLDGDHLQADVFVDFETRAAVVSPGSGQLAFVSTRNDPDGDIYTMNSDGSGLVNLTKSPGVDQSPAWSPDGTKIAFVSNRGDGEWDLYVMSADGSGVTRLTHDAAGEGDPVWSPDGTRIAVDRTDTLDAGFAEIYVVNADGSGSVNLSNNPGDNRHPAWSLDGSKIAFERWDGSNMEIHVVNVDGSGEANLTNRPNVDDDAPAWSPDGTRIAFTSGAVYVMNADGSGITQLTGGVAAYPRWSPDGTGIAFEHVVNTCRLGHGCSSSADYIWIVSADSQSVDSLTNTGMDQQPVWSPDGSKLAFISWRDGNAEIYVMNADGSGQVNLTNSPWSDASPAWRPK